MGSSPRLISGIANSLSRFRMTLTFDINRIQPLTCTFLSTYTLFTSVNSISNTKISFRKDILKMNPSRFEIGPVYSTNPRDRKTLRGGQMKPVSKELVFDIDLTDYDDIRSCCEKANICGKCWAFVTMAMKVVDTALREDFGFEHILWVYSGRRGAHAWVCDPRARNLPDDRRRAIAGYLDVLRGGTNSGKRVM